ncbi:MAG: hypothetical protein U0L18_05285 [Acutalibacteraceae bacterium]|nr:hypothetical protein [Acutalibacteraceae bacterium]
MIIYRILLLTLLIMVIYSCLIYVLYDEKESEEKQPEQPEEREKAYLTLQNMTTQEILLFKKKDDFIKDVGCYDVLRNFYNDDEIIKKIYPNYKRLD